MKSETSRRGATALGYGLIVGLIAVVALASITTAGSAVEALFDETSESLALDTAGSGATPEASVELVTTSCQTILTSAPSSTSGIYQIDPDGDGGNAPFDAYCDMDTQGGGWTLLVKSMVDNSEFHFAASRWTTGATLNPTSLDLWDNTNAMLEGYATVSGSEFLLRLDEDASNMVIDLTALPISPMTAVGYMAEPVDTVVEEQYNSSNSNCDWADFSPRDSSWNLQRAAMAKGVNLNAGFSYTRFGIIAENERNVTLAGTGWDSGVGMAVRNANSGSDAGSGNTYWPGAECPSGPYGLNAIGRDFWKTMLFIR